MVGVITSYTVADAVGRIRLDDGTELRFGATALGQLVPAIGLRVRVLKTAPHPLGGLRAVEIASAETEQDYAHKAATFAQAADAVDRGARGRHEFGPAGGPPLSRDERDALDQHRQAIEDEQRAFEQREQRIAELGAAAARAVATRGGDDVFVGLLRQLGVAEPSAQQLAAAGRPAALLVSSAAASGAAESKLGGDPDLPPAVAWPTFRERPLAFVAQIRLARAPAAVRRALALPDDGLVSFFYAAREQPWGFDPRDRGSCRVLFTRELDGLERRSPPPELSSSERFREQAVCCEEEFRPAPIGAPHLERIALDEAEAEAYADACAAYDHARQEPAHWLGGHPLPVQDAMETQVALVTHGAYLGGTKPTGLPEADLAVHAASAGAYRLLLQLDSDPALGTMWGDSGRVYFWARDRDIASCAFADAWCVLQGH